MVEGGVDGNAAVDPCHLWNRGQVGYFNGGLLINLFKVIVKRVSARID